MNKLFLAAVAAIIAVSCTNTKDTLTVSGLDPQNFISETEAGKTALYTLSNKNGMEVCITNFGARIVSMMVPDRDGVLRDVTLGFDNISSYIDNPSSFGAVMGRYANRIKGASFMLDGNEYILPKNNGENCIHGGPRSWQYSIYDVEEASDSRLVLNLVSPDGEFGFPGEIKFKVTYSLYEDNKLDVAYYAETSAPTVINVTNHSFFNLSGDPLRTVEDHFLTVDADTFTPTDESQIPTGEFMPVDGTVFDFRVAKEISSGIYDESDPQIALAKGYDHNFVLNRPGDDSVVAAEAYCPETGIVMSVFTDQPGIQIYTANSVNGTLLGKGGQYLQRYTGLCLETQKFPDSPHNPQFPSTELRPGSPMNTHTTFAFTVR